MIETLARIPVEVDYASEFRYRDPIIHQGDVVIAISQSGETADTLAALSEAKKRMKQGKKDIPYDAVWIVFDNDQHSKIPETYTNSAKEDINIAFSVMCFEYWILLHFENTSKGFLNCAQIISYIRKSHYPDYQKANENFFNKIKDRIPTAIDRAESIMQSRAAQINAGQMPWQFNSYTDVHLLLNYLSSL